MPVMEMTYNKRVGRAFENWILQFARSGNARRITRGAGNEIIPAL